MDKQIEELKTEIESLKIRLRRIEEFLLGFPEVSKYIKDDRQKEPELDSLFEDAIKIIVKYDEASASLLQRRLSIGYSRASRLLDQLGEKGYLEQGEGNKPRRVLIKSIK